LYRQALGDDDDDDGGGDDDTSEDATPTFRGYTERRHSNFQRGLPLSRQKLEPDFSEISKSPAR
jgi:hypothetical protein